MRHASVANLLALILLSWPAAAQESVHITWERLPDAPVHGGGRMLYGVHRDALIALADGLHVLRPGARAWEAVAGLPEPGAYAASAPLDEGVWLVPGEGADAPHALLTWDGARLRAGFPPPEPGREAALSGALRDAEEGRVRLGAGHELRVVPPDGLHLANHYTGAGFSPGSLPEDAGWDGTGALLAAGKRPVFITGDGRVYMGSFARAASSSLGALDYAAILVYLGALVGMGWYFSRREASTEQYFLGGRRLPWWAVGLSIFGTSLSAITYLSLSLIHI